MKETDKYIDQLFNAAKKEPPKISFEEISERFESSISAPPTTPSVKSWWSHLLNLNTLIMLSTGVLIISLFFFTNPATNEQDSVVMKQEAQNEEVMAEKNTAQVSDASNITKVDKTAVQSTMIPEVRGAKKTIISKNNSISPSSKMDVSTNPTTSSVTTTETTNISNESLNTTSEKLAIETTKTNSYSARGVENATKDSPDTIIESTDYQVAVPTPNQLPEPIKEVTNSKTKTLHLNYKDTHETTQRFLYNLKQYGFKVYNRVTRNPREIQKIVLEITHKDGLEWKMKLRNFEDLAFQINLDKNDKVTSITYRLNDGIFYSEPLKLHHKAKSNHRFGANDKNGSHSFTRKSHVKNN